MSSLSYRRSPIQNFFQSSVIFITGGTGFVGSSLIEKLLRKCTGVKKIYVLIRKKNSLSPEQRLDKMFESPIFQDLNSERPNFRSKIEIVNGDCALSNLGMSETCRKEIIEHVNCIFHCATKVNFNDNLKMSTLVNLRACKVLLNMSRQMLRLKVAVFVSSAFVNLPKNIDEMYYDCSLTSKQLIFLAENFDEDFLSEIMPTIVGPYKRSYNLTKVVAENIIKKEGDAIPVAVFRPSLVTSTCNGPAPGWMNNKYGAAGLLTVLDSGLCQIACCNPNANCDIVPVDYTANALIAVAWDVATNRSKSQSIHPIYNYVSQPENPITWREVVQLYYKYSTDGSIYKKLLYFITRHYYLFLLLHYFFGYLQMAILLTVEFCTMRHDYKKKLKIFRNQTNFIKMFATTISAEKNFTNVNVKRLWHGMAQRDREMFPFNIANIDWNSYIKDFIGGIQRMNI